MSNKKPTVVLVRTSYVLETFAVRSFAEYSGALNDYASEAKVPVESLLAQWAEEPYIPLQVDRYDAGHHFGPTLGMLVEGSVEELTIPWAEVLGVLGGQAAKKPIGLIVDSGATGEPAP
jgi:hypothetical protein